MFLLSTSLLLFEAAVRNSSFTKAADEHRITPLAIRHQIKKLEEYLGVILFDRSGLSIVPTEEGNILYKDLAEAITLVQQGVSNLKAATSHHDV